MSAASGDSVELELSANPWIKGRVLVREKDVVHSAAVDDSTAHAASNSNFDDETFWDRPDVKAQLARMKEIGVQAMKKARTVQEKKDCKKYYSDASLRQRTRLLADPEVLRALNLVWEVTDADKSGRIDRDEYIMMHRKLILALDPTVTPKEAFEAARDDWIRDSEGHHDGMDKDRFMRCWFELADLWVDSMHPEHYAHFLTGTIKCLTKVSMLTGLPEWQADREVIEAHVQRFQRGELDGGVYVHRTGGEGQWEEAKVEERRALVLARWGRQLRDDDLARAAAAQSAANLFAPAPASMLRRVIAAAAAPRPATAPAAASAGMEGGVSSLLPGVLLLEVKKSTRLAELARRRSLKRMEMQQQDAENAEQQAIRLAAEKAARDKEKDKGRRMLESIQRQEEARQIKVQQRRQQRLAEASAGALTAELPAVGTPAGDLATDPDLSNLGEIPMHTLSSGGTMAPSSSLLPEDAVRADAEGCTTHSQPDTQSHLPGVVAAATSAEVAVQQPTRKENGRSATSSMAALAGGRGGSSRSSPQPLPTTGPTNIVANSRSPPRGSSSNRGDRQNTRSPLPPPSAESRCALAATLSYSSPSLRTGFKPSPSAGALRGSPNSLQLRRPATATASAISITAIPSPLLAPTFLGQMDAWTPEAMSRATPEAMSRAKSAGARGPSLSPAVRGQSSSPAVALPLNGPLSAKLTLGRSSHPALRERHTQSQFVAVEGGTRSASGLLTGPATTQNFQELLDLARRYCAKHPLRKSNPVTGFVLEGGAVRASPQSLLPHAEPGVLPTLSVAHGSGSSLAAANVWQQLYEQQHERGA